MSTGAGSAAAAWRVPASPGAAVGHGLARLGRGAAPAPGRPVRGEPAAGRAAAGKGLTARARPAPGMGRAGSRSRGGCGRPSTSPAGLLPHRAPRPRPLPVTPAPGGLVAGETLPGRKAPRPPAQSPSPRELPAPGPAAPRGDLPPARGAAFLRVEAPPRLEPCAGFPSAGLGPSAAWRPGQARPGPGPPAQGRLSPSEGRGPGNWALPARARRLPARGPGPRLNGDWLGADTGGARAQRRECGRARPAVGSGRPWPSGFCQPKFRGCPACA